MRTRTRKLCRGMKVLVYVAVAQAPRDVANGFFKLRLVRHRGEWWGANREAGPLWRLVAIEEGVSWVRGWTGEDANALRAAVALS